MEKIRWKMRRKSERVVLTLVFIVFAIYAV